MSPPTLVLLPLIVVSLAVAQTLYDDPAIGQTSIESSTCGPHGVPFRLVVHPDSRPELNCMSPRCLEAAAFSPQHTNAALVTLADEVPDLFRRRSFHSNRMLARQRRYRRHGRSRRSSAYTAADMATVPQAECWGRYEETVCSEQDQWTGGLLELSNGTHRTLKTECCTYKGLHAAANVKTVTLQAGDVWQGGVVSLRPGDPPSAFDLVKEIRKTVSADNTVEYVLSIYRLPCTSAPADLQSLLSSTDGSTSAEGSKLKRGIASFEDDSDKDRDPQSSATPTVAAAAATATGRDADELGSDEGQDDEDSEDLEAAVATPLRPRRRRPQPPFRRRTNGPATRGAAAAAAAWLAARRRAALLRTAAAAADYDDDDAATEYADYDLPSTAVATPRRPAAVAYYARRGGAGANMLGNDRLWPVAYGGVRGRGQAAVGGRFGQRRRIHSQSAYIPEPLPSVSEEELVMVDGGDQSPAVSQLLPPPRPQPSPASEYTVKAPLPAVPSYSDQPPQQPLPQSVALPVAPPTYAIGAPMPTGANAYAQPLPAPSYPVAPTSSYVVAPAPAPAPAPAYQPSYSYPSSYQSSYPGGLNGLFDTMQCFSGDMIVETDQGPKPIKTLKTGDLVLSVEQNLVSYYPIVMHLHKDHTQEAEFLRFRLASGAELEVTELHIIYRVECDGDDEAPLIALHARDVTSGQCLVSNPRAHILRRDPVVEIQKIRGVGIYAPLTTTGDIIVNGVLASCHSNLQVRSLQQTFFSLHRAVSSAVGRLLGWTDEEEEEEGDRLFAGESSESGGLPLGTAALTRMLDYFIPIHKL